MGKTSRYAGRAGKVVVQAAGGNPVLGLILGGGLLIGGYWAFTKITGINPLGDSWNGFVTWLSHPFQTQIGLFVLSMDSARQGGYVVLKGAGLKPSADYVYGWKANPTTGFNGYQQQGITEPDGTLTLGITISYSTPPGYYTIYLDQRMSGGGYGERGFRVLA